MGGGMLAGAGQLVEGRGEWGADGDTGAGVGEVDGVRSQGRRVSVGSSSPAGIGSSFFGTVLLILCARVLARLPTTVSCSITFARQDDPSLLID